MDSRQLIAHLEIDRFGSFLLPEAVRPAPEASAPREGYRLETYCHAPTGIAIPAVAASVSAERSFDVFLALLKPLGSVVDVVLETSHDSEIGRHRDLRRTHVDRAVLESYLCEFEDVILHDGCTGVAVVSARRPMEVQFDEHKTLVCYGLDRKPFRKVLRRNGVVRDDDVKLVSESAHIHCSTPEMADRFAELAMRLGVVESKRKVRG